MADPFYAYTDSDFKLPKFKNMIVYLDRTALVFFEFCWFIMEWVVIMAQELSMH